MKVSAFAIDATRQLSPIPSDRIAEACKPDDACVWLDLQDADPAEVADWLDRLEVCGLSRRLCLEAADHSGFYPLRNEMILIVPIPVSNKAKEADQVVFLCRERLLVTIHPSPVFEARPEASVDNAAEWLPEASVASLVAAILVDVTQEGLLRTTVLRKEIETLEGHLIRDPDSVEAEQILDLRTNLLAQETVINEQLPPVQVLAATERPGLKMQGAHEYLNCALANLQASDRSLDRLDSRIDKLGNGFQMHSQDKTNRRLGMLTILSALFMPITLMAGIWGMNFENMPELGLSFGYPLALGGMAVVALGMFLFFRRGGWFD